MLCTGENHIEKDLSELLVPLSVSRRSHTSLSECSSIGNEKTDLGATKGHRKHQLSETSDGSYSSDSSGEFYAQEVNIYIV